MLKGTKNGYDIFLSVHDYEYTGTIFNVEIPECLGIFYGDSSTGKSYLFNMLNEYAALKNIERSLINYRSRLGVDRILESCKGAELVLLDNADLYLDNDLLYKIAKMDTVRSVLVAIKPNIRLNAVPWVGMRVEYDEEGIRTKFGRVALQ